MQPFQNSYGFGFKDEKVLLFFGNNHGELEQLKTAFPSFSFVRVKQTHSDIVISATPELTEADAHYGSEKNQALVIATADCMPIMIYCQQTNRVAAVHAGWRGVVNKITIKTLQTLISTGSDLKKFKIFVGPSIQQKSFEVDLDVFENIAASAENISVSDFSYSENNKFYIDLNKVLLSQLKNLLGPNCELQFSTVDTKTSTELYSYRRGKLRHERNLSFVCLLT